MMLITSHETSEAWKTAVRTQLTRLQCDEDQSEPHPFEVDELLLEEGVAYDPDIVALQEQLPPLRTESGVIIIDTPAHDLIPHERERWFRVQTLYDTLAVAIRLARSSEEKMHADMAYSQLCVNGYEAFWAWQETHGREGYMPGKEPWLCVVEDCDSHECLSFTPEGFQMILPALGQLKDGAGGWATWAALELLLES